MIIRKQRGLTLMGFLIALSIGLFFAYTAMRVVPIYLEYNALNNALKTVQQLPGVTNFPPNKIKDRIQRSLWVSYASGNIKNKHIKITRNKGINIRVKYEVRKPWIGNIDLLAHFDKTVVLKK
jgi:hypothetical protein